MQLDACINFMLTRTQNTVFNYFKEQLAEFDVTPAQYSILKCLWDKGDQSPTQLSHAVCLDSSTITGILRRLEAKGMIQRVHSEVDRRAVDIRLLPAGRGLQKGIEGAIEEANRQVLQGLDAASFAVFRQALEHINANVEGLAAQAK